MVVVAASQHMTNAQGDATCLSTFRTKQPCQQVAGARHAEVLPTFHFFDFLTTQIGMTPAKVETLHQAHPQIRAEDWRSPLVRRLLGCDKYTDGDRILDDTFRSDSNGPTSSKLKLSWVGLKDDFNRCVKTYQSPVITEMATLGLSCILLRNRAKMEITEVTLRGERADYWLGEKELLLEVSGQQSGSLKTLHNEKATQLRDNPFGKDGYVCVANFDERRAILHFHRHV